jgi:hypothetical protein
MDPGSVIGQNQDPDPGSGMNIPVHITESLETIFGLKYLNSLMWMRIRDQGIFLTLDPGSGMEKILPKTGVYIIITETLPLVCSQLSFILTVSSPF